MHVLQTLVELSEGIGSFLRYGGCAAQSLPCTADLLLHLFPLLVQHSCCCNQRAPCFHLYMWSPLCIYMYVYVYSFVSNNKIAVDTASIAQPYK